MSRLFRLSLPLLTIVFALPVTRAGESGVNLRRTLVVDVVQRTKDAVVYVSTTKMIEQRIGPFGNPFRQFGEPDEGRVPVGSLGSGFIVHPDGYVVTNYHVVDRARQINVELLNGKKLDAELISSDPEADLAILKIQSDQPLPTLALGDSSDLMIGEPAIAVGNPLGFSHTVSTGIVSALHRDLKNDGGEVQLSDLIQTDAAINPGNSGGPLLNAYGQVIGIDTAIRGDAQNIGFAIGVNRLRDLIPQLMNPSQVKKVDTGLTVHETRTLHEPADVLTRLTTDSHAGTITAIAGEKPRDVIDAYAILLRQKVGKAFDVRFGDGQVMSIEPKIVPLPDAVVQAREKLGIGLETLTPMLAAKYGLNEDEGLLATDVKRDSVAGRAGVQAGDEIVQLGMYRVATPDDFATVLDDFQKHPSKNRRLRIVIRRGEQVGLGMLQL